LQNLRRVHSEIALKSWKSGYCIAKDGEIIFASMHQYQTMWMHTLHYNKMEFLSKSEDWGY